MAFFIQTKPIPPQAGNRRSSAMRKALMDLEAGSNKCVTLFVDEGTDIKALRNRVSGAVNALRKQHGAQFVTRTIKEVRPNDDGTRGTGAEEDCVAIWKVADKPEAEEGGDRRHEDRRQGEKPAAKVQPKADTSAKPANPKATAAPAAKAEPKPAAKPTAKQDEEDMLAGLS